MTEKHTAVVMDKRPDCDVCRINGDVTPAYADAKSPNGPWGYVCEEHFKRFGCELGLGKGQRIIVDGEQP